jgi:hypothetical protein
MGLVAIDNLSPGMSLTSDVHDRNGRLLLGAGAELTDKHIYIFRTWGVVEVDILGVETDDESLAPSDTIDPDVLAAAAAEVGPLFRHADLAHPCMNQLLRLAVLRKAHYDVR